MLKSALWSTQKAIYQRLSNDQALIDKVHNVFDKVPEFIEDEQGNEIPVPFPYVNIGEPISSPFETKSSYGENIPWVLHCWSRYPGKKEAYEILDLMLQALTKESWNVEGFKIFKFNIEPNMQVIEDIDGETYHGIMRIRFHINN